MAVYALQTIYHGVKDGDGVKRVEFAPGEEIADKDGVKIPSSDVKEWIARGIASKRQPQVEEDEAAIDELDEKGEKRGGGVKSATKTNPPKEKDVVKNPPGTPAEPAGGAQP